MQRWTRGPLLAACLGLLAAQEAGAAGRLTVREVSVGPGSGVVRVKVGAGRISTGCRVKRAFVIHREQDNFKEYYAAALAALLTKRRITVRAQRGACFNNGHPRVQRLTVLD